MKKCSNCKKLKSSNEFHKDSFKKDKLCSTCKLCNSRRAALFYKNNRNSVISRIYKKYLVKNYGITLDDYKKLLTKQNKKCKICKRHESLFKNKLNIDHCHKTKKIRGILCGACNKMLGLAKDNIKTLSNAIKYLERNK